MLQKTEASEATTSPEVQLTSYMTSREREMFKQVKQPKNKNGKEIIKNDLLAFEPTQITSLAYPHIFTLENQLRVIIKSNFYQISGLRSHNKFIERSSKNNAEIVDFYAEKPTNKINIVSIERYQEEVKYENRIEMGLHLNVILFNPDTLITESNNIDVKLGPFESRQKYLYDYLAFKPIENFTKGLLFVKVIKLQNPLNYNLKVFVLDLKKTKQCIVGEEQYQLNVEEAEQKNRQVFIKTIKSDFGDIVLMATNREIYEIEFEEINEKYKITIKNYKLSKLMNETPDIIDICFVNGIKLMLLTSSQQAVYIEGKNIIFKQQLELSVSESQFSERYNAHYMLYNKIFVVNGMVAALFESKGNQNVLIKQVKFLTKFKEDQQKQQQEQQIVTSGVIILKLQSNGLSLIKAIHLPINKKNLYDKFIKIEPSCSSDQFYFQYINSKEPNCLKLNKCQIFVSELNSITLLEQKEFSLSKKVNYYGNKNQKENTLQLHHFLKQPQETSQISNVKKNIVTKVEIATASRVLYLLNDKQLICHQLYEQNIHVPFAHKKLFSIPFFEKPIKLAVSPLTLHLAVVFKQFVKFFFFNYSDIKHYYTLKIKNISDISFCGIGQKFIVTCSDGMIFEVDSYSFQDRKIIQFYGETVESKMINCAGTDQQKGKKLVVVKSSKHVLSIYQELKAQFKKVYEVKLQDGDQYFVNKKLLIVVRKNGALQIFQHEPSLMNIQTKQQFPQFYENLQKINPHLIIQKHCKSYLPNELPTDIVLNEELGFLMVSTTFGNIKEYLWPFNLNSESAFEVYSQKVAHCKITSIKLDETYSRLFVVNEDGVIQNLKIVQYHKGEALPYVFIINSKTKNLEEQKREFTDRNYFFNSYTPTENVITSALKENIQELEFIVDKIKDDIEETTKVLKTKGKKEEIIIKDDNKFHEKQFKEEIMSEQDKLRNQNQTVGREISIYEEQYRKEKHQEQQNYQKKLLELYRENDRLKNILSTQDKKLTSEKKQFIKQFEKNLQQLNLIKLKQVVSLQKQYNRIQDQRDKFQYQNKMEEQEEGKIVEMEKKVFSQMQQEQLNQEQYEKERLLGDNSRKEKQIANLKQRNIYFENLILQTKVQIGQLNTDQEEYVRKKDYLRNQLKDKEQVIEKLQKELVEYLKNTQSMKTVKNTHEFELNEYQKQLNPINQNFVKIETNIKQMNFEIMKEYTTKMERSQKISLGIQKINELKSQKMFATQKKLVMLNKFLRLSQKLNEISLNPFDRTLQAQLRSVLEGQQNILVLKDQEKQASKKQATKLLRYKNMLRKQIQEEEKRQQHISKNQHEFYKYHVQNTNLVREFNELKKNQKILTDKQQKLLSQLSNLKGHMTPKKKASSIHIRKLNDKKMTPFQRYEQQTVKKEQDTQQTKMTRGKGSQSISFLKSLMKEVNKSQNQFEKQEIMKERVRTFVNPELKNKNIQKTEEIKKILFGRTRGISEMLKLK